MQQAHPNRCSWRIYIQPNTIQNIMPWHNGFTVSAPSNISWNLLLQSPHSDTHEKIARLHNGLLAGEVWFKMWNLKINSHKTEAKVFNPKEYKLRFFIQLHWTIIGCLGCHWWSCIVSQSLLWYKTNQDLTHYEVTVKGLYKTLKAIPTAEEKVTSVVWLRVSIGFLRPLVTYACPLRIGLEKT